jgi:hypothetical protein
MPVSFYITAQQIQDYDVRRLRMLAAAVLACCIVGSAYAISIILHALQVEFNISQKTLTTVSSIGFVTQFFTLPGGISVDIVGPRSVIAFSTAVTALGWVLFALTFNQTVGHSTVALTFFDIILVATTGYADPACNLNNLFMFSLNRGLVVLVQKTWMGMSTMLLAITYITIFEAKSNDDGDTSNNNSTTAASSSGATSNSSSSSSSGSASFSNDSDEPHNATGVMQYCFVFAAIICIWGGIAFFFMRESPMQKLTRQKTYKKEPYEMVSERDSKLMEMMEESVGEEVELEVPSLQTVGNDVDDERLNRSDHLENDDLLAFETSDALQSAVLHHVPCDPRIVRAAQIFLVTNLVFLSGVSIIMLYITPSRTVGFVVAIISHLLTFTFFLLPFLRKYVWPPTKALRVTFPNVTRGQVLRWRVSTYQSNEGRIVVDLGLGDGVAASLPNMKVVSSNNNNTHSSHGKHSRTFQKDADESEESVRLLASRDPEQSGAKTKSGDDDHQQSKKNQQMIFPNMHRIRFFRALYSSCDLWLLFFAVSAIWGGGATFISNTIQMYDALAETHLNNNSSSLIPPPAKYPNLTTTTISGNFFLPGTNNFDLLASVPETAPTCFDSAALLSSISSTLQTVHSPKDTKMSRDASLTVSLMGAGSGIGRILVGVIEATILQPKRMSASILLPIPALLMAASCLIPFVLRPNSPALPAPFVLNALAYGSSWAVVLLSMRQMVAVDTAQFYMFLFLSGASSLIFGRVFLGPYYDEELNKQHAKPGQCVGIECISVSLYVMAIASGMSFLFSLVVHWRWMKRNGLGFFQSLPLPNEIDRVREEVGVIEQNVTN